MNSQVTNDIRELTADELDAVAGGYVAGMDDRAIMCVIALGACVSGWITGVLDYLFD